MIDVVYALKQALHAAGHNNNPPRVGPHCIATREPWRSVPHTCVMATVYVAQNPLAKANFWGDVFQTLDADQRNVSLVDMLLCPEGYCCQVCACVRACVCVRVCIVTGCVLELVCVWGGGSCMFVCGCGVVSVLVRVRGCVCSVCV